MPTPRSASMLESRRRSGAAVCAGDGAWRRRARRLAGRVLISARPGDPIAALAILRADQRKRRRDRLRTIAIDAGAGTNRRVDLRGQCGTDCNPPRDLDLAADVRD